MRALVYEGPGVLHVREVGDPGRREGHVPIRVARAGLCGTDRLIAQGGLARVRPPLVIGHEIGGFVAESGIAELPEDSPVAVQPTIPCMACRTCERGNRQACPSLRFLGVDLDGGAAELVLVPMRSVHRLAEGSPPWIAALAEPVAVAIHMAQRAGVVLGNDVLVAGGGPVGALVASICQLLGARSILIAEPVAQRRSLLESTGFVCLDPGQGTLLDLLGGREFDIAFELAGARGLMEQLPHVVRPHGTILFGALTSGSVLASLSTVMLREQTVVGSRAYSTDDFRRSVDLLGAGRLSLEWLITDELPLTDPRIERQLLGEGSFGMKTLIAMPT